MSNKYEMSKTYQYRKVMKPLLERKRRARINKSLDDLKDILTECIQQNSGDPNSKLEKADILEQAVGHLRNLKVQRQKRKFGTISTAPQQQQHQYQQHHNIDERNSFRNGYIQAANEVSKCLASLPNMNVELGTKLMTQLGLRLNQLESNQPEDSHITVTSPLNIICSDNLGIPSSRSTALNSPVSSGYASDSECSSSPSFVQHNGLLLAAAPTPVWRPW